MSEAEVSAFLEGTPDWGRCVEPGDTLVGEASGFPRDVYEYALVSVLLPSHENVLEMVTIPSFHAEEAVYLEVQDDGTCRATRAVASRSIWAAADWTQRFIDPSGVKLPEAIRTSASLSESTCKALRALWNMALAGRQPYQLTCSIPVDGTDFHFRDRAAGSPRSAEAPRGKAQPNVNALVALGTDLGRFTSASAEERGRLDADLGRRAVELAERFRRAAEPSP